MFEQVIDFWFNEIDSKMWWVKDTAFDQTIGERFGQLHTQATKCELYSWRDSSQGCLAEVIVLDQFSRNMYRDTALAFAADSLALALAQNAIARGFDQQLSKTQRGFLYIPFMHSESAAIHQIAVALYRQLGDENQLDYELRHQTIIERFGRYPGRNKALGRASTPQEIEFLKQPNSSF